jgi:5'-3' exonuclease
MGITNFTKWIKDTYPTSISEFSPTIKYDCVLFDMNHILHCCLSGCSNMDELQVKIETRLNTYINMFNCNTFTFIIDGPASYAKLLLQRKRRKDVNDISEYSTCNLTPGTELIQKIENMITLYLNKKKQQTYLKLTFNTYFSDCPGEGEIKINTILSKSNYKNAVIIGNDADIILIGLARTNIPNIHVYNNNIKNIEVIAVNNIVNSGNSNRYNFIFISLLLGNDYLPKLLHADYNKLWYLYNSNMNLKENSFIDYENMIANRKISYNDYSGLYLFFSNLKSLYPAKYLKFDKKKYDKIMVKNYVDGLLWNLYLYIYGDYPSQNYIYTYKTSPSITSILYFLLNDINSFDIPFSQIKPIPHNIYPVFTMPLGLIPEKYKFLVSKINSDMTVKDIERIRCVLQQ